MQPLTAEQMAESKIVILWKVWNWLDSEGEAIFFGYIGYSQKEGMMFPHVPAYLLREFDFYCKARLAKQRAEREEQ